MSGLVMSRLRDFAVRLVNLFRSERLEHDLDAELQAYLALEIDENIRRGMAPREARRAALAGLGSLNAVKDECRDVQRFRFADDLWRDLRHGMRRLLARPMLAVVATAVLAIGVGANISILGLVDALLLRPLPGVEPNRLVAVFTSDYSSGQPGANSYPDFLDIRSSTGDVFENLTAALLAPVGVRSGGETRLMSAEIVEPNYFETMGVSPAQGRGFEAVETAAVAVISNAVWLSEFGGDPSVLGRAIVVNGSPFTIVGVAPAELGSTQGIFRVDIRLPAAFEQLLRPDETRQDLRAARRYTIVGRLREGVGIGEAQALLEVVAGRLHQAHPEEWTTLSGRPRALTITEATGARLRLPPNVSGAAVGGLSVLTGLVVILLLVVCANISGLLLADASVRRREMSIRRALGARRSRLVRQVVVESLALGLAGGCVGVVAASAVMRAATLLLTDLPVPLQFDLQLNWRLLVTALVVSTSIGLAVGFLPALYATRPELGLGRFLQSRFRNTLTAIQAAAAVFLLITAGVFARGIVSAYAIPLGYDSDQLVLVTVDLEAAGYSPDRGRAYLRQALEQVPTAAVSEAPFLSLQAQGRRGVVVDGYEPRPGESLAVNANTVSPGYVRLMGVPLVEGRDLERGERNAVLVNRAFAQRFWSGQTAVGRRVGRRGISLSANEVQWSTVVGVVEDGHFVSLREDAIPVVFRSLEDAYASQVTFHIRNVSADAARRAIASVDPGVPVVTVATMSETVDTALLPARIAALVSGFAGVVGLVLACIGLLGTLSYVVAQRVPEIGLRVALGARPVQILRLIAGGTSVKLVAVGVVVGAGLAGGVAPLLQSQFSGGGGVDFATVAGVGACLALVASVGVGVPALRALKVDPADALRIAE